MFTFKQSFKSIKPALILATLCLSTLVGAAALTPTAEAQRGDTYGLGGNSSDTSGGAIRTGPKLIVFLVPPNGARTLLARPTFYCYISNGEDDPRKDFPITILLRDSTDSSPKTLFRQNGKGRAVGLYRFTLPENSPVLVEGKIQRLQVRIQSSSANTSDFVALNANILLDTNAQVLEAVSKASTGLEKARILAKALYWFDAIDAYTQWIEANPKDATAIKERNALLAQGFKSSNEAVQQKLDVILSELVDKLAKDTSIHEMILP
jgi:hypothetical protein